MLCGEGDQLRILVEEHVHSRLDVEPGRDGVPEDRLPDLGQPPSRRGDPDECCIGLVPERLRDGPDDGKAVERLAGVLGVEERHNLVRAVVQHPAHRLAVMRVGDVPLGKDQVPLHSCARIASRTPSPGSSGGT